MVFRSVFSSRSCFAMARLSSCINREVMICKSSATVESAVEPFCWGQQSAFGVNKVRPIQQKWYRRFEADFFPRC